MRQRVGVIGLGRMGQGIAGRLRSVGIETRGYDSLPGRGDCGSLAELVASCDVFLLSLPDAAAVEAVALGEGGLAELARPGQLVVDTSTSTPGTVRKVASRLGEADVRFVDAPVSGGRAGAESGSLTMLVGAEPEVVASVDPVILDSLTAKRIHLGPVGAAQAAKLLNNLLVATGLAAVGETLRVARAAGLDEESFVAALNESSGRSAVTEVNLPRWVLSGSFDSGFSMKLMRKDVAAALELARSLDVALPVHEAVGERWASSIAELADDADFNRIVELE